jgi:HPt (histidine-containing phosphotransfer) domain-containing protein
MSVDGPIHADLVEVWERSRPTVEQRVAVIERAVTAISTGAPDEELTAAALADAHKLAGLLGTFGLQRGTDLARRLERGLAGGPSREEAISLRQVVERLRGTIEDAG